MLGRLCPIYPTGISVQSVANGLLHFILSAMSATMTREVTKIVNQE